MSSPALQNGRPSGIESPRRGRAFTLVEILVVVVILGVISAVLIPQLSSRSDLVAAAAARQLMSDLTFAQNRAITQQTSVYVVFTEPTAAGPGGRYRVMSALPSTVMNHPINKGPWDVTCGGNTGAWSRVRLETATFDGQTAIMFDETGSPFAASASGGTLPTPLNAGSVRVVCNGFALTVRVEPFTGTLTVQ